MVNLRGHYTVNIRSIILVFLEELETIDRDDLFV